MTRHNTRDTTNAGNAGEGWGTLFPSPLRVCKRNEKHPPQPSPDDLHTPLDQQLRPPTSDEDRLAELRTEWQRHPDRRADIADEAARLKALHLITEAFPDAVVLETTEGSATP